MIAPQRTAPEGTVPRNTEVTARNIDTSGEPVTTLREAGVVVDARRVGRVSSVSAF
jgi:hypothetical protein